MKLPETRIDPDEVNHSELVQLCQFIGIPGASRAWSRDLLLYCLTNFEDRSGPNPLDDLRQLMHEWLDLRWKNMAMQADKKVCPNCHLCRDVEVLECYVRNKNQIGGRNAGG